MIKQFIPTSHTGRRSGIRISPTSITIHSTGNPRSTAKNEADNVCNNNPSLQVSFHVVVDEKEAYQVLPFNEVAWHAGDSVGSFIGTGNSTSIAVEICETGDRKKTLLNAAAVIRQIMKETGISTLRIHRDWSGKNCPRILIDPLYIKDGLDLGWFLTEVKRMIFNDVPDSRWSAEYIKKVKEWGLMSGDDSGNFRPKDPLTREEMAVILVRLKEQS